MKETPHESPGPQLKFADAPTLADALDAHQKALAEQLKSLPSYVKEKLLAVSLVAYCDGYFAGARRSLKVMEKTGSIKAIATSIMELIDDREAAGRAVDAMTKQQLEAEEGGAE